MINQEENQQNPIDPTPDLEQRVHALEHALRTHRHLGSDVSAKIGAGSATVYHGFVVNSSSAGTPFPAGWSVANNGTGDCTITHNLGTTAYTIVCTSEGTASVMSPQGQGTNTHQILSYTLAAALSSTDFYFAIIV